MQLPRRRGPRRPFPSSGWWWPAFLLALLFAGVVAMGWLQVRWSDELARTARDQAYANLSSTARRLGRTFDRGVVEAFLSFRPGFSEPPSELERRLVVAGERWRREAAVPGMVAAVAFAPLGGATMRRLVPGEPGMAEMPMDARLAAVSAQLLTVLEAEQLGRDGGRGRFPPLLRPELPGFAFPVVDFEATDLPATSPPLAGLVFVLLDPEVLAGDFLDHVLTQDRLETGESLDLAVAVGTGASPLRWRGAAVEPGAVPELDVAVLRLLPGLLADLTSPPSNAATGEPPAGAGEPWRLFVHDPGEPLSGVLARNRARRLVVSLGSLTLLAGAALALVLTARAAARLAAQQLRFVAGISHELRTPVAAIRSLADNLAAGVVSDPGKARQYGHQIGSEAERLAALTERALAFAGLASGQAKRERLPVALGEVVRRALEDQGRALEAAGARVVTRLDSVPPILGDANELRQAVGNLLANAAKFAGPAPQIEVTLGRGPSVAGTVVLTVRDLGPGIAVEEQRRLFEPFVRGAAAVEAQLPGSGLGLFLVRQAVEAAGGAVTLESRPGQGSSFRLRFPAVEVAHGA